MTSQSTRPATYGRPFARAATPDRIRKHLAFAASYLEQARLDLDNGYEAWAEAAMAKRRQHQQSLADIRELREEQRLNVEALIARVEEAQA